MASSVLLLLPGARTDFEASLNQAIAYARLASGARHPCDGRRGDTGGKGKGAPHIWQKTWLAAEKAPDLTILLEPINQRDKPGYFYSTIGEAASLIEEVDLPNIKIMFDVYHVGVSEGDILTRLRKYLPLIGHVQIAAVPSRAEPDEGRDRLPGNL